MLVHEAWRKLGGGGDPPPEGRRHFFFAAGRAMRDVLVERARTRLRQKRGGDRKRVDISTIEVAATAEPDGLLEVELAMEKLTAFNPRLARVVELRFFAGFTAEEAAEALEISLSTLEREWRMARAFLFRELSKGRRTEPDGGGPEISEGPKP
jgi:RNA polymerase sigma factor (TIGR02999 family)